MPIFGRGDYNLVNTDEDPLPPLEPAFLFRAQDSVAETILRIYAVILEHELHNPTMARQVREQADLFAAWPTKKRPDLPRGR
jgi:hypothetical protein